jgi:hypothetical protein
VVPLPRDIGGPEYAGIRQIAPTALRALGLRSGLTHMEWFRRPHGTVAVSEVGARPPGAQITSMLCYAHDFDLYTEWARLMIDGSFEPPERRWSAGTVYLRTPWHAAAGTVAEVWAAAERAGFPLIVKPIDGAGSADTYRADSTAELDAILPMIRHLPQVSVEEFIDAEEFTYDTICADGRGHRPSPGAAEGDGDGAALRRRAAPVRELTPRSAAEVRTAWCTSSARCVWR